MLASKFSKSITVTPSLCDHTGKLSISAIFDLFMDLAGEHAEILGFGLTKISEIHLYWLTVKTKIIISELPRMNDHIIIRTWPETPGRLKCNRYYEIASDNNILVNGKTEWAIINTESGALTKPSEIFPTDMEFLNEKTCTENFARILDNFTEPPYDTYRVRSTDIDVGQHMNNAKYIQMLIGTFSCTEWDELDLRSIDVTYKSSCFEGNLINIQKRSIDSCLELRISDNSDDKTILLASLQSREHHE